MPQAPDCRPAAYSVEGEAINRPAGERRCETVGRAMVCRSPRLISLTVPFALCFTPSRLWSGELVNRKGYGLTRQPTPEKLLADLPVIVARQGVDVLQPGGQVPLGHALAREVVAQLIQGDRGRGGGDDYGAWQFAALAVRITNQRDVRDARVPQ